MSEPKIQRLPLSDIEVDAENRLRPVSDAGVQSLIASIEELGVIKDAIHVRKKRRASGKTLVLMAGGHRLEAARRLGWETIPARVWADVTDDFARLMEIDDNLSGADLSNLELSVFLAERKRVYERMYPETKAGVAGGKARQKSATEIISFAESVAEKRELSARHIRNFIQIGNALSPREVAELAAAKEPLKLKDLMALAKIGEPIVRADIVGRLSSGEVKSVADALGKLQPGNSNAKDLDAVAFQKLAVAWERTPMKMKRRFVADQSVELLSLLKDLDGGL
ncbi:ParB N-terminal domain-containing protein [Roseobacter sp. HKCCD9010]|nr:ParB N-terminal domain-containing protein [Rhodobacterales bacterium HKCCD4356]NNV13548.1 ParB N-terminal domain-containing protein [Roseobacter sp. HKCCD7357]NNV16382.1 ParB N-terminal domain-containing protein [Roseobacter sp. HKCCD8768]NNV25841.1 ParB N-terminal domain-containing protein [Roseobacter sp. HKCCD8192]NNV30099.1 ParB N-terminal domain-containing protein [Roseobacter sp. HKCCD9061]NNV34086.1 ParB N-terminal domain-containing protein [Roseobacter sp. HKCCD9073]NNV38336.1 ParB